MEPINPNLEPIEESDLNLQEKFTGSSSETEKVPGERVANEREVESEDHSSEQDDSYSKILSKVQASSGDSDQTGDISEDAERAIAYTDADSQINHLVEIAMNKGVFHAVKVARHMQDNYVLDAFHDKILGDELHGALLKKGVIKDM